MWLELLMKIVLCKAFMSGNFVFRGKEDYVLII